MYLLMYDYIYVLFVCRVDYTYIDINVLAQGLTPFWPHKFGFKPLLGLEHMAPMLSQLLVSHANHSATETSMYVCMYVCMDVCMDVYMYACVYI